MLWSYWDLLQSETYYFAAMTDDVRFDLQNELITCHHRSSVASTAVLIQTQPVYVKVKVQSEITPPVECYIWN